MHYAGISTHQFLLYYASAIHKHMCILKDSELMGLNVDIAHLYWCHHPEVLDATLLVGTSAFLVTADCTTCAAG